MAERLSLEQIEKLGNEVFNVMVERMTEFRSPEEDLQGGKWFIDRQLATGKLLVARGMYLMHALMTGQITPDEILEISETGIDLSKIVTQGEVIETQVIEILEKSVNELGFPGAK